MALRPGSSAAHQQAVARRLALLDAELGAYRPHPTGDADHEPATVERPWVAVHRAGGPEPWEPLPGDGDAEVDEDARAVAGGEAHTRPRAVPVPDVGAAVLPRPGRHLSGRPGATLAEGARTRAAALVPEGLRGRAGLGAAQLGAVALAVGVGLVVTTWWTVRSEPEPLPPAAPVGALVTPSVTGSGAGATADASPTAPVEPGTSPADEEQEVVVDVAGKVRRPGIVVLPAGSRVADALDAAGGARPGVDLVPLNLARVLVDGEQVLVGRAGAGGAVPPPVPGATAAPGAPVGLVDLNTADLALLDTLPGVGPVTAQAIVDWRTENGGFSAVDDLLDVSGIGEVTLAELTPLVTV